MHRLMEEGSNVLWRIEMRGSPIAFPQSKPCFSTIFLLVEVAHDLLLSTDTTYSALLYYLEGSWTEKKRVNRWPLDILVHG